MTEINVPWLLDFIIWELAAITIVLAFLVGYLYNRRK